MMKTLKSVEESDLDGNISRKVFAAISN